MVMLFIILSVKKREKWVYSYEISVWIVSTILVSSVLACGNITPNVAKKTKVDIVTAKNGGVFAPMNIQ